MKGLVMIEKSKTVLKRILSLAVCICMCLSLVSCSMADKVEALLDSVGIGEDIEVSGIENYINGRDGGSTLETGDKLFYSRDFVTLFDYAEGEYYFYEEIDVLNSKYEVSLLRLKYSPEVYEIAKQNVFENTKDYETIDPQYTYNGYKFFTRRADNEYIFSGQLILNVFNDEKCFIFALGFYDFYPKDDFTLTNESIAVFLRTYYSEYYDFDV